MLEWPCLLPVNFLTRIPHLFRVVLLRRLRLPLPLSLHTCWCGRQIDKFGHHRASCARAGVLGRRGFALESATARVCREAGGRVTTNIMVRDLDLAEPRAADGRKMWIPQWCALSTVTDLHTEERRIWTVWCWRELVAGRNEHTQNWWSPEEEPVLWFLALRLEAACPWRPRHS